MTDLATKPVPADGSDDAQDPHVEWGAAEPRTRSRRGLWLGIGIPVAVVVAGAVASSFVFIAPGTTVLGASVGFHTAGTAQQTIADHIAQTEITIDVEGTSTTLTAGELGVTVDTEAAATTAHETHPLWNVGAWNSASAASVSVDEMQAAGALEAAHPDVFTAPVNAQLTVDDGRFEAVPDEPGIGVDADALAADIRSALESQGDVQALASGAEITAAAPDEAITVTAEVVEAHAPFTLADAEKTADDLNELAGGVTFTLDGDEVDSPAPDVVTSWLTVEVADDGAVSVDADEQAVQGYADALPEKVDQEAVDAEVVTNAAGDVLHTLTEGRNGHRVSSTDGVGAEIAAALEAGETPTAALAGETVEHETTERYRRAVVDKSAGYSYFYESVNGGEEKLVNSFPMAVGKPGFETQVGEFTVYGQLTIQNMGSCDANGNFVPGGRFDYCTANVPWVTYFNGDQGFHGTYWHSNFGQGAAMSHGCVNLTVSAAEWSYYFLQTGSPVSVVA